MNHYTIVKLVADRAAVEDKILMHFNEYMQNTAQPHGGGKSALHVSSPLSFVSECDGYFRVEYTDSIPATSAGIAKFGNFLTASGYTIKGISTGKTLEGEEGTEVQFFSASGKEERVVISTLNVY